MFNCGLSIFNKRILLLLLLLSLLPPPRKLCLPTVCLIVCLLVLHIKTTERILMKILPEMYLWRKKFQLSSGSHADPPWWRSALSDCSFFFKSELNATHEQSIIKLSEPIAVLVQGSGAEKWSSFKSAVLAMRVLLRVLLLRNCRTSSHWGKYDELRKCSPIDRTLPKQYGNRNSRTTYAGTRARRGWLPVATVDRCRTLDIVRSRRLLYDGHTGTRDALTADQPRRGRRSFQRVRR